MLSSLSHHACSLFVSFPCSPFIESTYKIHNSSPGVCYISVVASSHLLTPELCLTDPISGVFPLQPRWLVSHDSPNSSLFTERGRVHYRRSNSANNVLNEKHLSVTHTHTHTHADVPNTCTHIRSYTVSVIATDFHCCHHIKNTQS